MGLSVLPQSGSWIRASAPLPQFQDLGLKTLAIFRCSRWPLVRVLPTFHPDSVETRMPTTRIHAEVSESWIGGGGGTTSTEAAIVTRRGHGVRTAFSEVVQWPGLCFLANMLLLSRNYCVQGIHFKTRHCALLMFVWHNTGVTFMWFSSDLVSESLGGCHHVQCLTECSSGRKSLSAPGEQNSPGINTKSMGMTAGPLLQTQFQCHRKKAARKSNFQRVRTLHSVT